MRVIDGGREHLLTLREVAAKLQISTATAYKLVAQKHLVHIRVSNAIRVARADLEAFVEGQRVGARLGPSPAATEARHKT